MSERDTIVLKFGGTSVRDADAMRRVVKITKENGGQTPVVVTSACAGVTNDLVACGNFCVERNEAEAITIIDKLTERHLGILDDLCHDGSPHRCDRQLGLLLDELRQLVRGVILLGETTPRAIDMILSFGERLSSTILTTAFREAGINTGLADSRQVISTDGTHGSALPIISAIEPKGSEVIQPLQKSHDVVIAQGFIGSTLEGVTTTIGRGGSDHSAALFGVALGAKEIQIWTDVDGVMTADPRLVPEAKAVPEMTFTEARELAWFGAKIIHPDTILPALAKHIPVVIRNSHSPSAPGTRICPDDHSLSPGFHSLTIKRDLILVEIATRNPGMEREVLDRAIGLFAHYQAPIECAVIAESRASVLVSKSVWNDRLHVRIESICNVEIRKEMAILCLIGSGLRDTPALLSLPLTALHNIPIRLLAAGSSDHVVLLGIDEADGDNGLQALHEALFP